MRASVATASTPAVSAPSITPAASAVAGGFAVGFRWLRLSGLMCGAGFAGLARAVLPALDLIGWPVKAPNHLAQRLDLAFIGGFLALGFLDELEQFVHRLRRVAQGAEGRFDFLECFADGGR